MPEDVTETVFITYYKEKIHIAFHDEFSKERLDEIVGIFHNKFSIGNSSSLEGQLSGRIEIKENLVNVSKLIAKTAINTLAYIKGKIYITETSDFDEIIAMIFSETDEILTKLSEIGNSNIAKKDFNLQSYQHASIIFQEGHTLSAIV